MTNPISSSDTISSQLDPLDDRNLPLVRISVSNRENDSNALRSGKSSNCIRCGYFMDRSKAIFLMVQSPFKEHPSKIRISVNEGAPCTKCTLPKEVCKAVKHENGIDPESFNPNSPRSDKFEKAGKGDEFQSCQDNSSTLFPSCTDCHLTVLCDEDESKEIGSVDTITLMLEVPSSTKEEQDDHKLMTPKSEAGEAMFSEYLPQSMDNNVGKERGSEQSVSGAGRYASIPEMNSETEAAYQSHLKNLVPCSHCKRTFNPDRIMVHENACVERAKKRVTKIH